MRTILLIAGAMLLSMSFISGGQARPGGVGVGASAGANVSAGHTNTRAGL
jgi:hypothetical protein